MPPNNNNLMSQFFYKIFNKNKYKKNKYLAHIEKEKILFKNKYENYINLIQENLKKKRNFISSFWTYWRYSKCFTNSKRTFCNSCL